MNVDSFFFCQSKSFPIVLHSFGGCTVLPSGTKEKQKKQKKFWQRHSGNRLLKYAASALRPKNIKNECGRAKKHALFLQILVKIKVFEP